VRLPFFVLFSIVGKTRVCSERRKMLGVSAVPRLRCRELIREFINPERAHSFPRGALSVHSRAGRSPALAFVPNCETSTHIFVSRLALCAGPPFLPSPHHCRRKAVVLFLKNLPILNRGGGGGGEGLGGGAVSVFPTQVCFRVPPSCRRRKDLSTTK
jgi:hypothetical protein